MKAARRLGLPLIASVLTHAYAGWHLYAARQEPLIKADPDRFEVRMLTLPPPAVVESPPPPEVPPPPKPLPPPSQPRVKPAAPEPPPDPAPAPETPPSPVAPPAEVAVTAPPALLAEGTSNSGAGVVQRPGNAIGSLASAAPPPSISSARTPGPSLRPATAVTRLSDLSRKPRPPSLDAALRRNYPADHRRRGIEGQAEVRVLVTADGRVGHASVVSESAAGFGRACHDTLLGTRWSEPVSQDGKAVNTLLTYRCRFEVGD